MNVLPQQIQSPNNIANVMDMINRLTQSSNSAPTATATLMPRATAQASDPYVSLLEKVADTQSLMAKVMDKAFNTISKVMNFAMTHLFKPAAQEVQLPAGANVLGNGLAGAGSLPGLVQQSPTQLPTASNSSGNWLDTAVKVGKEVWGFLNSDKGSGVLNQVKDFGSSAWSGVKDMAGSAWDSIKGFGGSIANSISGIGSTVGGWLGKAGSFLGGLF